MAEYNCWMNERLYAVCAEIPDEERKRDAHAFFKSIHGTLNHLLVGDKLWLGRFLDDPFPVESLDQELYADFDAMRAERERTDDVTITFIFLRYSRSIRDVIGRCLLAPIPYSSNVSRISDPLSRD